ncbi:MAG: hypothetical protein ACM359_09180, partial [Bacillota bacterium]
FRAGDWKRMYPDRSEPPSWYLRFPAEDDAFDLTIEGGRIVAKHRQSGAQWMLQVPQKLVAWGDGFPTAAPWALAEDGGRQSEGGSRDFEKGRRHEGT